MTQLPSVSVIIPVLNAERDIRVALTSLMALDYPPDLVEVIVVDNGSTDHTREVVGEFPVTLMVEEGAKNAYTARNAAIRRAKGEIIAFTDGDCVIDPRWLRAAVGAIRNQNADMVGGNIIFTFPRGMTAGSIVDSMVNLRNDQRASKRGRAVTANLVVKASLFTSLGLFPDGNPMAGDIIWTSNASGKGFKMVYAPDAVVHHPARDLKGLLRKTYTLARAYAYQQRAMLTPDMNRRTVARLLRMYVPPNPRWVWKTLRQRGGPAMTKKLVGVWFVLYAHSTLWATGSLISLAEDARQRARK